MAESRKYIDTNAYNIISKSSPLVIAAATVFQDPARHLDALPRRYETGDNEHGNRLRERLDKELQQCSVVPDQDGTLCGITDVSYAPEELTKDRTEDVALKKWANFEGRPPAWLHHKALTTGRMAKIDRLCGSRRALTWNPRALRSETTWTNGVRRSPFARMVG